MDWLVSVGKSLLYFPEGTYSYSYDTADVSDRLRVSGDITFVGDGKGKSIIYYKDNENSGRRDFFSTGGVAVDADVDLRNICVMADWGDGGDWGTGNKSQLIALILTKTNRFTATGCRFENTRYMALAVSGAYSATVENNEFIRTTADGCRLTDIDHTIVTGNYFRDVNDDSIAIHSKDDRAAPVMNSAVVTGNNLVDSQGIAVLGAKKTVIADNVITRPIARGIIVGASTGSGTEGNTAPINISITDNVISDVIAGSAFSTSSGALGHYIYLRNFDLTDTAGGYYVGDSDGSGGVLEPWDYLYTNDIDAASGVNPGSWWINISGNQCTRTIEPTANYSDYGFGSRYGRSGPVDPAITSAHLINHLLVVDGGIRDSRISGNILSGGERGIYLNGDYSVPVEYSNVSISENIITNVSEGGIVASAVGMLHIDNNTIDGDPFHVATARAANGKWGVGYGDFFGIWLEAVRGAASNNTFKNVGTVFKGTTLDRVRWDNNKIVCDPVASGYDANNAGIGDISRPERYGAAVIIADCDPASATFGEIQNICLTASTAMPSTGTYVHGHFVRNAVPVVAGSGGSQYVVLGWTRLTTGSGHVLDTDWAEARAMTGT
ncbi:MAG: right-handed parallel beta-helix repeat-containing protein [Planctomycetales bacterium]|nr:right-handed parallel beta-helix repeat-containing protein [Planctomycetales bacterium]